MTNDNDIHGIRGFSMAMYSTWLWHKATRSMFDAGEGISPSMRNHVFAIENVFLTHGHHDHIGGLAGLVLSRGAARGDKGKPLNVYHPRGWRKIDALKDYIKAVSWDMTYDLRWIAIGDGDEVSVSDNGKTTIKAFEVKHTPGGTCLGYAIMEKRARLRQEFIGLTGGEIAAIVREKGRDAINESYEKAVMAYSGDCSAFDHSRIMGVDVLFHEATFVQPDEMDDAGGHSTIAMAVEKAKAIGAGTLVLVHLSTRFSDDEAVAAARKEIIDQGYGGAVRMLHGNRSRQIAERETS